MKTKTSIYHRTFAFAYALLVAVIFCGCEPINNEQQKKVEATELNDYSVSNEGVQILTIDSCEYVWCKNGHGAGLTHKGNCKFCAERSKK
jgi:hypothetical protein